MTSVLRPLLLCLLLIGLQPIRGYSQCTDIWTAIRAADPKGVQACIDAKADLKALDAKGRTPMLMAIAGDGGAVVPERQRKIVVALLSGGSDPAAADGKGYTALHYAAYHGNYDLVGLLLRQGAPLEALNFSGESPLLLAARGPLMDDDRRKTFDSLLLHRPNVRVVDTAGESTLHLICNHRSRLESPDVADENIQALAQRLIELGADFKGEDGKGNTALGMAIQQGHQRTALWLLSKGAFATPPALASYSGLHLAVERLQLPLVEALLKAGVDVNRQTGDKRQSEGNPYFFPKGSTPLDIALISEHEVKDEGLKSAYKAMASELKSRGGISRTFEEFVKGFKAVKGGGAPPSSKTGVRR